MGSATKITHSNFYLKSEHRNKYQRIVFLHLNGGNMVKKQPRFCNLYMHMQNNAQEVF